MNIFAAGLATKFGQSSIMKSIDDKDQIKDNLNDSGTGGNKTPQVTSIQEISAKSIERSQT